MNSIGPVFLTFDPPVSIGTSAATKENDSPSLDWLDQISWLAFGKEAPLQTHGKDTYERTLADMLLLDGTDINHALVKDGWCWWYRKYAPLNTELQSVSYRVFQEYCPGLVGEILQ